MADNQHTAGAPNSGTYHTFLQSHDSIGVTTSAVFGHTAATVENAQPPSDKKPASWLTRKVLLISIGIIAGLIIIIGAVAGIISNGKQASINKQNSLAVTSSFDNFNATDTGNGLQIFATVVSVDVVGLTVKMQYQFSLSGPYLSTTATDLINSVAADSLVIIIGSDTYKYTANQSLIMAQGTVLLNSGDYNLYPFDTYTSGISVTAAFGKNGSIQVPLYFGIWGVPNGFAIDAEILESNSANTSIGVGSTQLFAEINPSRSKTIKTFALLISIGMWIMTLLSCALAIALPTFGKKAELPHIALTVTLLFAMPNVRNAMPSAPAVGSLIDQAVLVWAMLLLAVCVSSHFIRLLRATLPDHKKTG